MQNGRLTMTIAEFSEASGISKGLCYTLARQDKLPIKVIHLGERRMVLSRAEVESLLSGNGKSQDVRPDN